MCMLLVLASLGAAVRYWSPDPSLAHDIGTLMLVLWLPAIGNLIAYVVREAQARMHQRAGFDARPLFTKHFCAQLVVVPGHAALVQSIAAGDTRCIVLLGTEAFSARTAVPLRTLLGITTGDAVLAEIELLRPELALARLVASTRFHLVVGTTAVAEGTVAP